MKKCEICGTPYSGPVTKFNNGNPVEVNLPECDCQAEANFQDWLARRAAADGNKKD